MCAISFILLSVSCVPFSKAQKEKSANRFVLYAYYFVEVPLPLYLISTNQFTPHGVNFHHLFRYNVYFGVFRQKEQERKALYVNN